MNTAVLKSPSDSVKSLSNSLIVRGILAVVIGALALAWPGITVFALVVLFAISAFGFACFEGIRAFTTPRGWPVVGHSLLALIDVAAGVVALVWPGETALVLALVVGFWAIAAGVVEFFTAFLREWTGGQRALFLIGGLISVAFGLLLVGRPVAGAVSIALIFGMLLVIFGIWQLGAGIEVRRTGKAVQSFPGAGTGPQPAGQRGPSAAAEPTGSGADASLPRPRQPERDTAQQTDAGKK